jgi:hypothetical protein
MILVDGILYYYIPIIAICVEPFFFSFFLFQQDLGTLLLYVKNKYIKLAKLLIYNNDQNLISHKQYQRT